MIAGVAVVTKIRPLTGAMAFCMVVGAASRRVGWPCQAGCRALSRAEICRGERGQEQAAADSTASTSVDNNRSSSFAEAFKRFEDVSQPKADVARPSDSFLTLLRNSPFVKVNTDGHLFMKLIIPQ